MQLRTQLVCRHGAFEMLASAYGRRTVSHVARKPTRAEPVNMNVEERICTQQFGSILQFTPCFETVGMLDDQFTPAVAQNSDVFWNFVPSIDDQEFLEREKFCFANDLYPIVIKLNPKRCRAVC